MKKTSTLLALVVLLLVAASTAASTAMAGSDRITVKLEPVGNSGVHGTADLRQLSMDETHIKVVAKGLKANNKYVSLYYDNNTCEIEPYSKDDVIGGRYTANQKGIGHTSGDADDPLEDINSVSVRSAKDFTLLACADVHPT